MTGSVDLLAGIRRRFTSAEQGADRRTPPSCDHDWVYFGHLWGSMTPYHSHRRCRECGEAHAGTLHDGMFHRRPWADGTSQKRSDRRFTNGRYGPENGRLLDPHPLRVDDDAVDVVRCSDCHETIRLDTARREGICPDCGYELGWVGP